MYEKRLGAGREKGNISLTVGVTFWSMSHQLYEAHHAKKKVSYRGTGMKERRNRQCGKRAYALHLWVTNREGSGKGEEILSGRYTIPVKEEKYHHPRAGKRELWGIGRAGDAGKEEGSCCPVGGGEATVGEEKNPGRFPLLWKGGAA